MGAVRQTQGSAGRDRQSGAVLIMVMAGMVVLLAMAGMALDFGHAYLNKSRLQNLLDAASLSAAKVLNSTFSTAQARDAALAAFELGREGDLLDPALVPIVEFSDTLSPFTPGGANPRYVRARLDSLPMDTWLIHVLPGVAKTVVVGASAVAGPSPALGTDPEGEACDLAPLLMCGDPADTDCSDGHCYGYTMGAETEVVLKTGAKAGGGWDVGPGNYRLLTFDCGTGGSCVRKNLAGEYSNCASLADTVRTEPGNTVGPTAQGLNTRFGIHNGPVSAEDYPPDVVTHHDPTFWWNSYKGRLMSGPKDYPEPAGVPNRRVLAVPVGNCTGTTNGRGDVPVLGFACFFLTQPAKQSGSQEVYGQLIYECQASGSSAENPPPGLVAGPGPGTGPSLYEIILYKDPDSRDS